MVSQENGSNQQDPENSPRLSKAFKGKLPITELTEDESVLLALGRLGYGPRPGGLDRVKEMGLEKWIDQQLDPSSNDDSALDACLGQFKTLSMSSKQLLDAYPRTDTLAKKEGITIDQAKAEIQQKAQAARQAVAANASGRAQLALSKIQGAATNCRRAIDGEAGSRRLQQSPVRSGDDRFLIQPFQRVRE
jgi:hypothetical protein